MTMGEHTRVLTHRTRYIVNKTLDLQKIHKETSVKPEQWFKWFNTNKSVNTFVDNRSYADIVKNVHPSKPNNFDILQARALLQKSINAMQVYDRNALIQNAFNSNALGPDQLVLFCSRGSNAILSIEENSPIRKVLFNWQISSLFCNHYQMMQMIIRQIAHSLLIYWKAIKTKRGKHWA